MKKTIFLLFCLTAGAQAWADSDAIKPENRQEVKEFCSNKDLWQHYPKVSKKACLQAASECIGDQDTAAQGWRQNFFRCVFDKLEVNAAD